MDKYDKAIEHLTQNPNSIKEVWGNPHCYESGCLFQFASPTGECIEENDPGCLTQIHRNPNLMAGNLNPVLVAEIVADTRIPSRAVDITVENLPVFAEWQRRLDKELNRV